MRFVASVTVVVVVVVVVDVDVQALIAKRVPSGATGYGKQHVIFLLHHLRTDHMTAVENLIHLYARALFFLSPSSHCE